MGEFITALPLPLLYDDVVVTGFVTSSHDFELTPAPVSMAAML